MHTAQRGAKVVLLTTGTRHAASILDALAARSLRVDAVVLERPRKAGRLKQVRDVFRRRGLGATVAAIWRRVLDNLAKDRAPWRSAEFFRTRTDRLIEVESLTAPETSATLRDVGPDILVLGGTPILPSDILDCARLGTLNAHPGLLPQYRGVDVVAHAILDGNAVGATVHYVDAGIDTGRIVSRTEVELRRGDTLDAVQRRVEAAGAAALAAAIARLSADGELPAEVQTAREPLRRALSSERRRAAEARLRHAG